MSVAQVPVAGVAASALAFIRGSSFFGFEERRSAECLKEELFSLESEKLTGAVSPAEYAETKAALETVLKRALKNKS